jgi:hypothetical protein
MKTVIPALQGFLDKKKEWKNINSSTPFFYLRGRVYSSTGSLN